MHSGTGFTRLVTWAASLLACLTMAGLPADRAGDQPTTGQSASSQAAASPAPTQPVAVATPDDPAPAPDADKKQEQPDFLHSIEVYGLVDGYYQWSFNRTDPQLQNFAVNHNSYRL